MKIAMGKLVATNLRYILLACLLLGLVFVTYLFFQVDDDKWSAFLGGISGGLVGVTISFLFSMYEYANIDRYRTLGVLNILPNRRDTSYYIDIIKKAKGTVQVMGTSCTRFINDFADANSNEHVLIDALNKHQNLKIELLVPTDEKMDKQSSLRFEAGKEKLRQLQGTFKERVQLKRYNFEPRHSLVRVDNDLIVGPVFQQVESQHSPAIHLDINKEFADKYLEYFEVVWKESSTYSDENCH